MANNTFIEVPQDVTNPTSLYRFLARLVEQLDVAFGERSADKFVSETELQATREEAREDAKELVSEATSGLATTRSVQLLEGALGQPNLPDLNILSVVRSSTYVQVEAQEVADQVEAIGDKVDDILAILARSGIMLR